jgi:hypothetical protein
MEDKCNPQTWQDLLRQIVADPKEKERILQQVNIQAVTLTRWIKGTCTPRGENIRALLRTIPPSYSQAFTHLLCVDFPNFALEQTKRDSLRSELPLEFYVCVLNACANMQPPLYPQVLRDLILQQMIKQFDPNRFGLTIRIARCLWHQSENKVRSLQVIGEIGTPPCSRDLGQRTIFLGAESLAGIAVMKCRSAAARRAEDTPLNPVRWEEDEQSMLAYPLMSQTRIAGCLLIASTRSDAFSEAHHKLLERYAHLMALAFESDAFFDAKDIALHIMPPYSCQEPLVGQLRQRVLQTAQRLCLPMSEAQERVWQEIEEELIQLAEAE